MKKKALLMITIFLMIFLLARCTNSQFDSSYEKFKESYILATDFVEEDNDSLKALEKMDSDLVESELKKMKDAMDIMSMELTSNNEKGIYENVKGYYQRLEFLLHTYENIDTLSIDEKLDVDTEIIIVIMNRESIKKGEV
jgi:uncharacterized protein YpmB